MNPHLRRKRTTVLNKKKLTEKKSFCFLFSPGAGAGAGAGAVPHFEKKPVPVPQKKCGASSLNETQALLLEYAIAMSFLLTDTAKCASSCWTRSPRTLTRRTLP